MTTTLLLYDSLMKIIFIITSIYILYLIRFRFRATDEQGLDNFKIGYLLIGIFTASLISNYTYDGVTSIFPYNWLVDVYPFPFVSLNALGLMVGKFLA